MYPLMCKISKNISTDAQDMQCSVQILAPSDAKSSSPSTPGQRGWSLAGGEIFIVLMQKKRCVFVLPFSFCKRKGCQLLSKHVYCFPSHPDRGGLGVEMWLKLVNSVCLVNKNEKWILTCPINHG